MTGDYGLYDETPVCYDRGVTVEPPRIEQVLIKYLFRRLFYSNSKKCCLIVTNYPYKRAVDHPQGTGKPALL